MELGALKNKITLESPTARTPDGDGGYTESWAVLNPPYAWASIENATQRALERLVSNTVVSQATHIVTMRWHPGLTTQSRITWVDRAGNSHVAAVTDVNDVDERGVEMILLVAEIVT